jgi:transposase InsO family protein
MVGCLGHPDRLDRLADRLPLAHQHIDLAQLRHDLLWRVPPLRHRIDPPSFGLTLKADPFFGGRSDGSCIRLRPERSNHVWAYDFVKDRTHDGRKYRMLCVLDEFTRQCLAIQVARRLGSIDVIEMLAELCLDHGVPDHVRSDQGPEFIAMAVREWVAAVGAKTAFIEKASPRENGYVESFNGKLRDELLNAEIFYSLAEARIMIETWRRHYNTVRPHSRAGLPSAGTVRRAVAGRARPVTGRAAGHCTAATEHAVTLTLQLDPFLGAGQ